jgi:hypothetical protein
MEAHARDEWPVGTTVDPIVTQSTNGNGELVTSEEIVHLHQAQSIQDRSLAMKAIVRDLSPAKEMRLLLDTMDNVFNTEYSSWPFRCWIVDSTGRVAYKSHPPSTGIAEELSVRELSDWLTSNVQS